MKVNKPAIIIHLKKNSQRLKNKNLKKINSIPLFELTFKKLFKNNFFEIYIDSSSNYFKKKAEKYGFHFIKRPERLNSSTAQGNELLLKCLPKVNHEIIIQLFVTNPFISLSTLKKLVTKLKKIKGDSVTAVTPIYNRFWYNSREVNHKYNKLIGTQYINPVYIEAGVYCFKKSRFLIEKSRILKKNFFYKINEIESFDIDTELDFISAKNLFRLKFKVL